MVASWVFHKYTSYNDDADNEFMTEIIYELFTNILSLILAGLLPREVVQATAVRIVHTSNKHNIFPEKSYFMSAAPCVYGFFCLGRLRICATR